MKFNRFTSILLIAVVCLVGSCKGSKEKSTLSNITYSEELAREISFVTSGDIVFDEVIRVIFNNDIVEENEVNSSPGDVFEFSPRIKGKGVWVSRNILQFKPDGPLPTRTRIDGKLKLQALSEEFKEKQLEDLVFSMNVLGRNLSGFNGSLDLKDRDDPKILIYSGSVSFSQDTDMEALKNASGLKGPGNPSITWSKLDDRNFQFTSSEIVRTERSQDFTFQIDRRQLDLENSFSESFSVTPLTKMVANDFRSDESGRSPRIRIGFSDDLDMDQHLDGLISVEPAVTFEVKKLGKSAVLDGQFKFGETYKITVEKGIRSRWGTRTEREATHQLRFSDIHPQIEFASDGIILPSSNKKKIQFYTTNLKRVHLEVKKVFPSQVGLFIRTEQLSSTKTRNRGFTDNYASAVGVIVKNQTIELKEQSNEWLLHEFDLSELFSKYDDGFFLIRINFTAEDVNMPIPGDVLTHLYEKGQVYKPVFLSDLGLTVKTTENEVFAFATDIVTGKPRAGVSVSLLDWNGSSFVTETTNSQGLARFKSSRYFYYVLAEQGKQVTALSKDEMQWSSSGFDVGGVRESKTSNKGFIYTERGVYRPGDSIHIGFIVRNSQNTFPKNHPVSITINDPQYNTVFQQTLITSNDGFYVFKLKTDDNAPTGSYNIRINAGGSWFYQELKIETVVAEQLRVQVSPAKRQVTWTDKSIDFDLSAIYLFGAPAANLKAEVNIEIIPHRQMFTKYSGFFFSREDIEFKQFTQTVLKKDLDASGNLSGSWTITPMGIVPSALKAKIIGKVLEKSGQPNEGWNVVDLHVYPNYVGLSDPSGYGYFKTGQQVRFPVVLLDVNGNPVSGRQLRYRIFRNDKRWWYQYDSRRSYQLKYKEDSQTYLEAEGSISSTDGVSYVSFVPTENGEYLIEVNDGGSGHSASMFFSAYQWGSAPGGDLNEGNLALRSDKQKYAPNETAKILLPNPGHGNILVTVEKSREILNWFWVDPTRSKSDELVIDVPLNSSMVPNAYVTVSVLQPHDQTQNDRPLRMFGIIPIHVEDPASRIVFNIDADASLSPNKDFEIRITTQNQRPAQFTIAVVDEGLLSLTQFQTPRPWNEFFRKVGLFVETFDVFAHVISANKGDVFQTFSIGGAEELDYRESQLDPLDGKKRFIPVSMFKGPLRTDERGRATVKFSMPNYNGAVRVMVIGAEKGSFGHADRTIPVRSDLIMQPGIPRVLNPGDEFFLPVALFRMNPAIKNARFTLRTEGPLEISGNSSFSVDFGEQDEADIRFRIKVREAVGQAKIILEGVSGSYSVQSETDIMVVPTSPRIYDKRTEKLEKEKSLSMNVPAVGLDGTNYARLDISIFPNMDFDHRLKWLIRYPYGCLEQTTSAVFPQLTLKKMGYFRPDELAEIDKNINEGINRMQLYMVPSGGFAYWPGNNTESEWTSNYASHFLVEARKMGYAVPDYLYNHAINSMRNAARAHRGELTTRVNRSFILALAGQQQMSEMNLLMENEVEKMNNAERWMLATAYHLAGAENIRDQVLSSTGTETREYDPFSYSFGSKHRDDAIIVYCATLMGKMDTAELLARNVSSVLSGREYLSTQSAGYMLLALGRYFDAAGISMDEGQVIAGTLTLANGQKVEFNEKGRFSMPVRNNFNKDIQVSLASSSNVDQVYVSLSWNGVPLKDEMKAVQQNLSLEVTWYDEAGSPVNPERLRQGSTVYGRYSVRNTSPASRVSELALMQIIPSGWQIENIRLNNTLLPDWTRNWELNRENYQDIRDDRVMWFFDLKDSQTLDFMVKINCVTAGDFWLPGTLLEAMYNNDYKAKTEGKKVHVEAFK